MGRYDSRRFQVINSAIFQAVKKYKPNGRSFLRSEFLNKFYSWIPEFKASYDKLSDREKVKYAEYAFRNGKLAKFEVRDGRFTQSRDQNNLHRVSRYLPVFDMEQRQNAETCIREFFRDTIIESTYAIEAAIEGALNELKALPEHRFSQEAYDNSNRLARERELLRHAYLYFKERADNKISNENILAELLWYSLCGRYNYSYTDHPAPNVYLASKGEIEQDETFNLDDRCKDANRLLVIAFAATTFLAGRLISESVYGPKWRKFFNKLADSKAKIDVVTVRVGSLAEKDAIDYKMRPLTINSSIDIKDIVTKNHENFKDSVKANDLKNVHLYTTDIALPVSYVLAEYEDHSKDNIKVDLYLPIINDYDRSTKSKEYKLLDESRCDNTIRQSFIVYKNNKSTEKLYEVLRQNAEDILRTSTMVF